MTPHPLLAVLLDAVAGRFPAVDGAVGVLPPLAAGVRDGVHRACGREHGTACGRCAGP
ncbi:hypothetical protein [Jiangella ureilytica]|uniref:hypothetical protein n=1 Tax=Jiangella ureilytica TaxID=2530374 RepID=UPI00193EA142|nr:hypothetical protein [Jiangella ureilytica]